MKYLVITTFDDGSDPIVDELPSYDKAEKHFSAEIEGNETNEITEATIFLCEIKEIARSKTLFVREKV